MFTKRTEKRLENGKLVGFVLWFPVNKDGGNYFGEFLVLHPTIKYSNIFYSFYSGWNLTEVVGGTNPIERDKD